MEVKAEIPLTLLEGRQAPVLLQAYFEFNHLKQLYRQGWLRRGVPARRCESVAEHTFSVAVLALLLADGYFPDLDACRVLRLALVHDFGEIYAGDIIPADDLLAEDKHSLERQGVEQVFAKLPGGEAYLALWEEYEAGETPEACLVRQVDRLEMGLQAAVYEHQGYPDLGEFFESARQALSDPALVDLMRGAEEHRPV